MTIERKLLSTSPSDDAANVAEVFSAEVYRGNATARSMTNGIDLAGEGGMVWLKKRNGSGYHRLFDTARTGGKAIFTNVTNAENSVTEISSFNSNGFSLTSGSDANINNNELAAFTFRKKEKFFDVVTFTANGSSNQTISHNLGSVPGMIMTKKTNGTNNWYTYHKGLNNGTNPQQYWIELDGTGGKQGANANFWNNTAPTDTQFTVGSAFNGTYVAYIFADNSSEDAEDQMIECGSYTGSSNNVAVNLGWEPQWLLIKNTTSTGNWFMCDAQRGMPAFGNMSNLVANTADAENGVEGFNNNVATSPTGFTVAYGKTSTNTNNHVYIYIAIRAPMMKEPETATEVFALSSRATVAANAADVRFYSGFPVDMYIRRDRRDQSSVDNYLVDRKNHNNTDGTSGDTKYFYTNQAGNFNNSSDWLGTNKGIEPHLSDESNDGRAIAKMWKRAKGFFDVVSYVGTGSATTVPHSLGAVPEMIWVKRSNGSGGWSVYTAEGAGSKYLHLEEVYAYSISSSRFNNTAATSTVFSVSNNDATNRIAGQYIAYLFTTLAGISKCGTYTGNGSYQTIPCGFSAGSRSVLIKRTDNNGDWYVWDSIAGIVSGNDPHMSLNNQAAEILNDDSIDPANSGFIVNQVSGININVSSAKYIFYAIA